MEEDVIIYIPSSYKDFGYKTEGSVGFDICSNEEIIIPPKDYRLVSTGIRIKINKKNIFPLVVPRSSLFIKKGLILANSVGVIDLDYCGVDDEIKLILYNIRDNPCKISIGERLAQIIFLNFEKPNIRIVRNLLYFDKISRGGFGSTKGYF